ncbi:MAG TPA: arylsulfatase [Vicinamibacterales bacterium]|nr:arylsulfatase [Vicinamibacterales bacterium]
MTRAVGARRWAIGALLAVAGMAAARSPGVAQGTPQSTQPDILIVQADDLGYGDLSAYGQAHFRTPAVDRLAAEGARFTQYYAGSTVCAPSRAVLMMGLHTGHVSIRGNSELPLPAADRTLAMILRDAGYRTALVGKWGLGDPGTPGQPDRKGFDDSYGFLNQRHAHRQYTEHLYRNGDRIEVDPATEYVNDLFTREAETFIRRDDPRPFFLYLNYTVPHAELRVPAEAMEPFLGRFVEKPFVNQKADARPTGWEATSLGYRSQATPRAAFAAMITRMDRDVGRLVDLLRSRRGNRRALVLFTSDNGPHREGGADPDFFNSSGGLRGIKRDLYEGGIRVPMVAWGPGLVAAGRVSDHPWAHWDLLPTLAELAGARVPAGLDGRSMTRALRGEPQETHDHLYWEFHERGFQQAVRTGPWKAVRLKRGAPLELYNLPADPAEMRDVAGLHPDVVQKIETYLESARTENPNWPVK